MGGRILGCCYVRNTCDYCHVAREGRNLMTVSNCRCGGCVRQRIIRAFLIEEQKIVKRVLNDQQKKK
jgi:large subunit ribosomal protein L34e